MNIKFEKVINGVAEYISGEIYPNMNDWQELIARIAVGRVLGNTNLLKQKIMENPLLMSFVMIDTDGMMDAERFLSDLKSIISQKGSLKISIPALGSMSFVESDVDRLHEYIKRQL